MIFQNGAIGSAVMSPLVEFISAAGGAVLIDTGGNNAPFVQTPIADTVATEGVAFSFTFPTNTFGDIDLDTLTYTSNASGWLGFNASTRTFAGTPTAVDIGTQTITVTATDPSSAFISDSFNIVISAAVTGLDGKYLTSTEDYYLESSDGYYLRGT